MSVLKDLSELTEFVQNVHLLTSTILPLVNVSSNVTKMKSLLMGSVYALMDSSRLMEFVLNVLQDNSTIPLFQVVSHPVD